MAYIIPALAAILFLISFSLFLLPGFTRKRLYFFFDPKWINVVIVLRTLSGFVVLAAAPASGVPEVMLVFGAGIIFVAFVTPFMLDEQLELMAAWWMSLSNLTLRLWAILWMLIWFVFGYIALPKDSYFAAYAASHISKFLSSF